VKVRKIKLEEAVNLLTSGSCVGKQASLSRGMIPLATITYLAGGEKNGPISAAAYFSHVRRYSP
jgi:hypothetical protein